MVTIATRLGLPDKVVRMMCPILSSSVLAIFCMYAIVVHFNVTMVTYHQDYTSFKSPLGMWTLCADSASPCNDPLSPLASAGEGHQLQVQSERSANNAQVVDSSDKVTSPQASGPVANTSNLKSHAHSLSHAPANAGNGFVSSGGKGYVIAVDFDEQLCSGLYDLYQLTNVANWWNMTLVEPYVQGSQFNFHPPPPVATTPWTLRYRDIIDLTETNRLFRRCLKIEHDVITSFEAVVRDAPLISHIVIIHLTRFSSRQSRCESLYDTEALKLKRMMTNLVRNAAISGETYKSRLVNFIGVPHRLLCVDTRNATDFRYLLKNITQSYSNILVLIPKWRGIRTSPNRFFYYDPSFKPPCGQLHGLPNSKKVQLAADKYRNFLQLEHPYIGVHLRLERIIRQNRQVTNFMTNCINEFFTVLQNLLISQNQTIKVVAFSDYSDSGSQTCSSVGCKEVADKLNLNEKLRELGVTVGHFNPDLFGEVSVSGYVAMIELELLSKADYLVTLGYGTYHQRLFHRFYAMQGSDWTKSTKWIQSGDDNRLFTVCNYLAVRKKAMNSAKVDV